MDTIMEIKSKNMADILESCIDTLKEGFQKTLGRTMKWTLHATEQDAISEVGRAELVFLMLVNALAHLDTEMSGILLREADRWTIFPRITKYMGGKMDAEWEVPREMLDRASRFARVLELSGLFCVPPELRSFLDQLLAEGEAGGSGEAFPTYEQSKRPRKDPRGSLSKQGAEASGGERHQERCYRLAARRRRPHKRVSTSPPLHIVRSASQPTPEPSKKQTSTSPQLTTKPTGTISKVRSPKSVGPLTVHSPPTGAIPKVRKPKSVGPLTVHSPPTGAIPKVCMSVGPLTVHSPPTGAIPKVLKPKSVGPLTVHSPPTGAIPKVCMPKSVGPLTVHSPPTGAIPKVCMGEGTRSPAAVGRERAVSSPRARQVTSPGCQTEEYSTPGTVEVTCTASQTAPLPRVTKKEAQKQMWKGVREDNGQLIEGAGLSGADLEEEGEDKMTPLTLAAREGQVEAVRALISLGARLEGRDGGWQGSSLYWASKRGQEEVVRELLAAGASVGAENMNRATPLHTASQWGHLSITRLLVEAGAGVGAEDNDRETPLHYAAVWGHLAIARLLVDAGADLNPRNKKGETPLALAELNKKHAVAQYLRSLGAMR